MKTLARCVAIVWVVILTGCGHERDQPAEATVTERLVGREFISQQVNGYTLVHGTELRLRFDLDQLSASGGCNSLAGPYRVDATSDTSGVLVIDEDGLSTTDIGCDPDRHAQDEWLADLLTSEPLVTLTADGLTLGDGTTTIDFIDRQIADPDRPLTGTNWKVDTIIDHDASSSVPDHGSVTFLFGDDGHLVVTSPNCTSAVVPYERSGDTLSFGDFAVDAIGCPTPWTEAIDLLRAATAVLTIDHGRLTLTTTSGTGLALVDEDDRLAPGTT